MDTDERPRRNANLPQPPDEKELSKLLIRLLDLIAVHIAEQLRHYDSTEPERPPEKSEPR